MNETEPVEMIGSVFLLRQACSIFLLQKAGIVISFAYKMGSFVQGLSIYVFKIKTSVLL